MFFNKRVTPQSAAKLERYMIVDAKNEFSEARRSGCPEMSTSGDFTRITWTRYLDSELVMSHVLCSGCCVTIWNLMEAHGSFNY